MSTGYFSQKERAKLGEEWETNRVYFAQKMKSNRYNQNNRSWFGRRTPILFTAASLYQLSHLVSNNFVCFNEVDVFQFCMGEVEDYLLQIFQDHQQCLLFYPKACIQI